jgi:hypothetical protein
MKPFAQLILCSAAALLVVGPVQAQTSPEKKSDAPAASSGSGSSGSPSSGSSSSPSSSAGASAARGKVPVKQGQSRKQFFDSLDTNSDGSISRAEAAASPALVILFPDTDTNSDGNLSVIEFEVVPLTNPDGTAVQ